MPELETCNPGLVRLMRSQTLVCLALMVGLAPIASSLTMLVLAPAHWGQSSPLAVLTMAVFGLFTPLLWTTYVPTLIITPLLLNAADKKGIFRTMRPSVLLTGFLIGAIAGMLVMLPLVFVTLRDNEPALARDWAISGGVAGSVTLTLTVFVYHRMSSRPPRLP